MVKRLTSRPITRVRRSNGSRDSSVGTVTRLRDDYSNRSSIYGKGKRFCCLLQNGQTDYGAQPEILTLSSCYTEYPLYSYRYLSSVQQI